MPEQKHSFKIKNTWVTFTIMEAPAHGNKGLGWSMAENKMGDVE